MSEQGISDKLRNGLAWVTLLVTLLVLWLIKPKVDVYERTMYLPVITDRQSINYKDVSLLSSEHYFLYKKIGYITVTIPDGEDTSSQYKAISEARSIAANAGAEKLLLEGLRSTVWFDTGKKVLRLHAIAMSQS